jgi:DNA-binding NarL/FixJ family response regulator
LVSQGYVVVDSQPMRSLIDGARPGPGPGQRPTDSGELPALTAWESDIAASLAQGHSIRQTERALVTSPKTAENTQTGLFRKLGVRNRAEALGAPEELGLLPDTPGALLA